MQSDDKQEIRAFRGYYVNMNAVIPLLNEVLEDAEKSRKEITVIGNQHSWKLDGCILSLKALKDILCQYELYGDFIILQDPLKEVAVEEPVKPVEEAKEEIKKILGANGEPIV